MPHINIPDMGDTFYTVDTSHICSVQKCTARKSNINKICSTDQANSYDICVGVGFESITLKRSNKIKVQIGFNEHDCLIDTGAIFNCISQGELLKLMPTDYSTPVRPRIAKCYLADDRPVNVLSMVFIPMTIGSREYDVCFHVIPSDNTDLILGCEFLTQTHAILDCIKNVMYIKEPVSNPGGLTTGPSGANVISVAPPYSVLSTALAHPPDSAPTSAISVCEDGTHVSMSDTPPILHDPPTINSIQLDMLASHSRIPNGKKPSRPCLNVATNKGELDDQKVITVGPHEQPQDHTPRICAINQARIPNYKIPGPRIFHSKQIAPTRPLDVRYQGLRVPHAETQGKLQVGPRIIENRTGLNSHRYINGSTDNTVEHSHDSGSATLVNATIAPGTRTFHDNGVLPKRSLERSTISNKDVRVVTPRSPERSFTSQDARVTGTRSQGRSSTSRADLVHTASVNIHTPEVGPEDGQAATSGGATKVNTFTTQGQSDSKLKGRQNAVLLCKNICHSSQVASGTALHQDNLADSMSLNIKLIDIFGNNDFEYTSDATNSNDFDRFVDRFDYVEEFVQDDDTPPPNATDNIPSNDKDNVLSSIHARYNVPPYPRPTNLDPVEFDLSESCLTEEQKTLMQAMLQENRDVFANSLREIGLTHKFISHIDLLPNAVPYISKPYSESPQKSKIIGEQLKEWLENDIVAPATFSSWASPLVLVKKSGSTNKWRICTDLRRLNQATVPYTYPVHKLDQILFSCGQENLKYLTTIDLSSAFFQIPLDEESQDICTFVCSSGHYKYLRSPFGLMNLPAIFCRAVDTMFEGLIGRFLNIYMDDLIIYSRTFEDHVSHLEQVFCRLREYGFTASTTKIKVANKAVKYVGHILSGSGIRCDPANIAKIADCEPPTTLKETRRCIGMFSYYKKFIKDFSHICKPLYEATRKENLPFSLSSAALEAFESLKSKLITAPVLALADFKSDQLFRIYTDASDNGAGYVLTQMQPDPLYEGTEESKLMERTILYGGCSFTDTQRRYSTIEKEMLAIVLATRKLHPYLFNRTAMLFTDARSIKFLLKSQSILNSKILRWILQLQNYSLIVNHIPGTANVTADYLSRMNHDNKEPQESILKPSMLSRIDVLCHEYLDGSQDGNLLAKLDIYKGNIAAFDIECIVNATNTKLEPRSGVDGAIQSRGGPKLRADCKAIGYCPLGGAVITYGYDLPAKYVIHTTGPNKDEPLLFLNECYKSIFRLIKRHQLETIGIPCISTGAFRVDPQVACDIAMNAVVRGLRENPSIKRVIFIMLSRDQANIDSYTQALDRLWYRSDTKWYKSQRSSLCKINITTPSLTTGKKLQDLFDNDNHLDTNPYLFCYGDIIDLDSEYVESEVAKLSLHIEEQRDAGIKTVDTHGSLDIPAKLPVFSPDFSPGHGYEEDLLDDYAESEQSEDWEHACDQILNPNPHDPVCDFDIPELILAQRVDSDFGAKIHYIENGEIPDNLSKKQVHKLLCNINDFYMSDNGLLYRLNSEGRISKTRILSAQLCLPKEYQPQVVSNIHCMNGHFGFLKVLLKAREKYYWPTMNGDVKRIISCCSVCTFSNAKSQRRVPLNPAAVASGPFQEVHIDVLGASGISSGFKYILVIVDSFSRLTRCVALRTKSAKEVCNAFYKHWINYYGCPIALISDNGREFVNNIMSYMLESFKIRMINTSTYHPESNAKVEKCNRTILGVIRRLVNDQPSKWSTHLDAACLAINNSVSLSTHKSPFELTHGIQMTAPSEYRVPRMDSKLPVDEKSAIQHWMENIQLIRSYSKDVMTEAQRVQKMNYDVKTHPHQLKVGDLVCMKRERLPSHGYKLAQKFSGVYKILSFTSATNVELLDLESDDLVKRRIHINKLKKLDFNYADPSKYEYMPLEQDIDTLLDKKDTTSRTKPTRRPPFESRTTPRQVRFDDSVSNMTTHQLIQEIKKREIEMALPAKTFPKRTSQQVEVTQPTVVNRQFVERVLTPVKPGSDLGLNPRPSLYQDISFMDLDQSTSQAPARSPHPMMTRSKTAAATHLLDLTLGATTPPRAKPPVLKPIITTGKHRSQPVNMDPIPEVVDPIDREDLGGSMWHPLSDTVTSPAAVPIRPESFGDPSDALGDLVGATGGIEPDMTLRAPERHSLTSESGNEEEAVILGPTEGG